MIGSTVIGGASADITRPVRQDPWPWLGADIQGEATARIHAGDSLDAYADWPPPMTIVSDGAYGVGGFPGDPRTPDDLATWYRPHVAAWSKAALRASTLWFWNTEIGWATVHSLLAEHGWEYVEAISWNKGIGHIAGKVNGNTIRQFPVATEICVLYRRRLEFPTRDGPMIAKEWLRYEWQRAGLRLSQANVACGVKNSATRKYLTRDWLWYFPPPTMMERLVAFANQHGRADGRPYFSIDGSRPITGVEWATFRDVWTHQHGLTNVWTHPPLNGNERYRGNGRRSAPRVHNPTQQSAVHLNQKPLEFMRRILIASTQPGDTVWEPFGGLCTAAVAAVELGRNAFAAEQVPAFYELAAERVAQAKGRVLESAGAKARETKGSKATSLQRKSPDGVARTRRERDRRLQPASSR